MLTIKSEYYFSSDMNIDYNFVMYTYIFDALYHRRLGQGYCIVLYVVFSRKFELVASIYFRVYIEIIDIILALKLTIRRLFAILVQGLRFALDVFAPKRIDYKDYFVHETLKDQTAHFL